MSTKDNEIDDLNNHYKHLYEWLKEHGMHDEYYIKTNDSTANWIATILQIKFQYDEKGNRLSMLYGRPFNEFIAWVR